MEKEKEQQHEDDALDEALEETFPASDPIAVTPQPPEPEDEPTKPARKSGLKP